MLRDGDGADLAEVADDEATASNPDHRRPQPWREWEVELAPGVSRASGEALQDAVADAFERPPPAVGVKSKLARGLGARSAAPGSLELPGREAGGGPRRPSRADAVGAAPRRALSARPRAREGDPRRRCTGSGLTARRLRSVLRVFRGVVADGRGGAALSQALERLGLHPGARPATSQVRAELLDRTSTRRRPDFVTHETVMRPQSELRRGLREAARRPGARPSASPPTSSCSTGWTFCSPPGPRPERPPTTTVTVRAARAARRVEADPEARREAAPKLYRAHRRRRPRRCPQRPEGRAAAALRARGRARPELKGTATPGRRRTRCRTRSATLSTRGRRRRLVDAAGTARWAERGHFGYGASRRWPRPSTATPPSRVPPKLAKQL